MKYIDYIELKHPINISTKNRICRNIKSMKKEQKNKIIKGMNINV